MRSLTTSLSMSLSSSCECSSRPPAMRCTSAPGATPPSPQTTAHPPASPPLSRFLGPLLLPPPSPHRASDWAIGPPVYTSALATAPPLSPGTTGPPSALRASRSCGRASVEPLANLRCRTASLLLRCRQITFLYSCSSGQPSAPAPPLHACCSSMQIDATTLGQHFPQQLKYSA